MTPQETLKWAEARAAKLQALMRGHVVVGLPSDKVGGKVYSDGQTVIQIGAKHEFGDPAEGLPQRSFLRAPFRLKAKTLNDAIRGQYTNAMQGASAEVALGRIGAVARNISVGAFTSAGYGTWRPLSPRTIVAKGSSQTLIDTGTLRNSITWSVRGV